ncbi:hypothetical protein PG994_002545 [Apiospora phragmitis]|uniref:C2H2-type domain-containing protein n=1 Tax=Apiospora phragmitis TaxID=2905665 RepID=A0ABR1W997_9PEZI
MPLNNSLPGTPATENKLRPLPPILAPAWASRPRPSSSQTPTMVDWGHDMSTGESGFGGRRKRKRSAMDEGDDQGRLSAKLSTGGFACPFYKSESSKYVDCLAYVTAGLGKNVKQHIIRYHKAPDYHCPTCGEIFAAQEPMDEHIRARECAQKDFFHPGMTKSQQTQINKIIGNRRGGKTDEVKWYEMWAVLFPGRDRPDSPYRRSVEYEMANNVQRFMQTPMYQTLRDSHYPEFQNNAMEQARMAGFVDSVLDAHAKNAEEGRGGDATADIPLPLEEDLEQLYCDPNSIIGDWVFTDPGE